jgi:hypothetical protein
MSMPPLVLTYDRRREGQVNEMPPLVLPYDRRREGRVNDLIKVLQFAGSPLSLS